MTALLLSLLLGSTATAADFPQAEISNGQIAAKVYLPDANEGYYRSSRFDWPRAVFRMQYAGQEFCGKWFHKIDPNVINWVHQGSQIVSGPCSALFGPADVRTQRNANMQHVLCRSLWHE